MSSFVLPVAMTSVLAVMLTILAVVVFLFYRKRRKSRSMEEVLEPMTRAKERSSFKRNSSRKGRKNNVVAEKQAIVCMLFCKLFHFHILTA